MGHTPLLPSVIIFRRHDCMMCSLSLPAPPISWWVPWGKAESNNPPH